MLNPSHPSSPRLLDRLADALHVRHYAPGLIRAYVDWVRRFIFFHHKRHPAELGAVEVAAFLDYLGGPEAEATLFQHAEAGRALHFLYTVLLENPLPNLTLPPGLPDAPPSSTGAESAPKLLDQMRHVLRVRHYARRTEDCYTDWAKRFIFFHNKRHPVDLGSDEVSAFLDYLAGAEKPLSLSARRQARHFAFITASFWRSPLPTSV